MKKLITTTMCVCLAMTALGNDTEIPGTGGIPDLTKGGTLTRINRRWAGPVGSLGNHYDFALGMNWQGVIKDQRVKRYK